MAMTNSATADSVCKHQHVMSEINIGPIHLGMNIRDIRKIGYEIKLQRSSYEGVEYELYELNLGCDGLVIFVYPNQVGNTYKLSTSSKCFALSNRLSVGVTLNALKKHYPNGKLVASDDAYKFNWILPDYQGVFVFDASPFLDRCKKNYSTCADYLGDESSTEFFIFRVD